MTLTTFLLTKKNGIDDKILSPPCLYRNPERKTEIFPLPDHSELLKDLQARELAEASNPKLALGYSDESYKTPKRGFVRNKIENLASQVEKMSVTDSDLVRPSSSAEIKVEGEEVSINNINLTIDLKSPKKTSGQTFPSKNDNEKWWSDALSAVTDEDLNVSLDFLDSDE